MEDRSMADLEATVRRLGTAFWITVIGIAAVLAGTLIVVITFHSVSDVGKVIPAILAPILTTIGTLVGAVAGHAAGGAGAEAARTELARSQARAVAYRQKLTPDEIDDVHKRNADMF
jgi:hypothetical protein